MSCRSFAARSDGRARRLIAHNPVADADKPATRRRKPNLPSLEDIHRLADAMPDRGAATLVLFAAFTGARKAECFALRWSDVDLTPRERGRPDRAPAPAAHSTISADDWQRRATSLGSLRDRPD